jgi:hypothetical protein
LAAIILATDGRLNVLTSTGDALHGVRGAGGASEHRAAGPPRA